MYPIKTFLERLGEILAELDALGEGVDADSAEDLEDLNAELEDALLLLSELRPDGEDWREEITGALEDIQALAGDYRDMTEDVPELDALAERLERTAATALGALEA